MLLYRTPIRTCVLLCAQKPFALNATVLSSAAFQPIKVITRRQPEWMRSPREGVYGEQTLPSRALACLPVSAAASLIESMRAVQCTTLGRTSPAGASCGSRARRASTCSCATPSCCSTRPTAPRTATSVSSPRLSPRLSPRCRLDTERCCRLIRRREPALGQGHRHVHPEGRSGRRASRLLLHAARYKPRPPSLLSTALDVKAAFRSAASSPLLARRVPVCRADIPRREGPAAAVSRDAHRHQRPELRGPRGRSDLRR